MEEKESNMKTGFESWIYASPHRAALRRLAHRALLALLLIAFLSTAVSAQEPTEEGAATLAKTIQNPIASVITLPLQFNWNTGAGPYDRTYFNLNVQPVIPFQGKKWNVVARAILPIISAPQGETDSIFGIGDTNLSLFWTPAESGKLIWGVGPAVNLPTASNPEVLGSGKFGIGPSVVALVQPGQWTIGGVVNNIWSVSGDGEREDTNLLTLQYFINYNLGGGWTVGTSPIVTANWEADSDDTWTIPWGLQVSKVARFGSQPVNLMLGYYTNAKHPQDGPDAQIRFQINFIFPAKGN
jgi:hypothetical protein